MPTYAYACPRCGRVTEFFLSIGEYSRNRPALFCCAEPMERHFQVAPALAIHNALASERHYEGLRATDGTPIDTRAKHREYMRANNLTTVDDFASTWKRAAAERKATLAGDDPQRVRDIAQAVAKLGG